MIKRTALALALGLGLTLGLLCLMGSQSGVALADPGILYVAPGGNCGGATPCYATVQAAVDAASAGDEIRVAAGVYTDVSARAGVTQTVYISKTVTIRGGYTTANWTVPDPATHPTILDARGQGRVVVVRDAADVRLDGLNITGGDATGLGGGPAGRDAGGGIYAYSAMSVTLSNNQVYSNSASVDWLYSISYGGGLYLIFSDYALLEGNTIHHNGANRAGHGFGGGLYGDRSHHVTLKDNVVRENVAVTLNGGGGGLYMSDCDYTTLEDNLVQDNTASTGADAHGGGLYLVHCHHASLNGNVIQGNVASRATWGYGGGLYLHGGNDVILQNNVIVSNTASSNPAASGGWGGGLYLLLSNATLVNTVVADNCAPLAGSGIYAAGSVPQILHATIARNSGPGGGLYADTSPRGDVYSSVALTNTLIVSHTVGITVTANSTATLNATLWHANATDHAGNAIHVNDHTGDPAFAADGYHLTLGSAAKNQGVDAGVTTDIDGQARPQCGGYDLGVDELPCLYLPLALR